MKLRSLAAAVLGGAVVACGSGREAPPPVPGAIEVRVAPVRRGDISDEISALGQTAALSVVRLASPVAGRVTSLIVRPGDRLARGAVAARVIPTENEAALHGFALLEEADALHSKDRALARHLRQQLSGWDIALRAPFSAVVADRLHNPGEQVAENEGLLDLFDPQSLYVIAQIPLRDAARVRPGMTVEVHRADGSGRGHVSALLAAVTPQTLTVPVRISLTQPLPVPLLHAPVQCRITVQRHLQTLLIPRPALLSSQVAGEGTVMVAENSRARRRAVQLGLRTDRAVEITAGLSAGELVITEGHYALPDGSPIRWTQGSP